MNPDLLLPIVTTIAWLVLACVGFASYRLNWSQVLKIALAWIAIFFGLFVVVEWFMIAKGATSALL